MPRSIRLFALAFLASATAAPALAAQIEAEPIVLRGDPIEVTVAGVAPGSVVRIGATQAYRGRYFRAWGDFSADTSGTVSTGGSPADGTWRGVDPSGLFWSGLPIDAPGPDQGSDGETVKIEAMIVGAVVASRTIRIVDALPDSLSEMPISEPGLVGYFARPKDGGTALPSLIVLGGSEGGLDVARPLARRLAARGFAALAVAYFGAEGMSPRLIGIPVETLEPARNWLARQPGVDADRLGVVGISKGAELAMLAASRYPWIKAVGAVVPSTHVYEGIAFSKEETGRSSWTIAGKDVPFIAYPQPDTFRTFSLYRTGPHPWLTPIHEKALAIADAAVLQAARIPIERIGAAVFCAGGYEDTVWASGRMCDRIGRDLRAAGRMDAEALTFLFAGHGLAGGGYYPVAGDLNGRRTPGGEPSFTAAAQVETWSRLVAFLRSTLGG